MAGFVCRTVLIQREGFYIYYGFLHINNTFSVIVLESCKKRRREELRHVGFFGGVAFTRFGEGNVYRYYVFYTNYLFNSVPDIVSSLCHLF